MACAEPAVAAPDPEPTPARLMPPAPADTETALRELRAKCLELGGGFMS